MQVLVLNSGSSSIKYRLFDDSLTLLASGLVERIGEASGRAVHRRHDEGGPAELVEQAAFDDHAAGFRSLIAALEQGGLGEELGAIGHRVVHGGEEFVAPSLIDDEVVARIRAQVPLAPLHNPANLTGIEVAASLRPELPQVAVFDTAFHGTLPARAYRYALPTELYREHGVRRYGFHGTSHAFVARRAAAHLGRSLGELDLITLHLGNGASATAISGGRSIDTSMGLTPLEGLVMGTRCGDVDPAVLLHLHRQAGYDLDEIDRLLNRSSGLLGLCGENDLREIDRRARAGDADAELALDVYTYRIRKYLGAYTAALGGLDAVVFTAGVGENQPGVRARVCDDLEVLGIRLDASSNASADVGAAPDGVVAVHAADARVAVLVVATDEEREIAEQTLQALGGTVSRP